MVGEEENGWPPGMSGVVGCEEEEEGGRGDLVEGEVAVVRVICPLDRSESRSTETVASCAVNRSTSSSALARARRSSATCQRKKVDMSTRYTETPTDKQRTSALASEKSSTLKFSSSLSRSSFVFSKSAHLLTSVSLLRFRLVLLLRSAVHSVSRLATWVRRLKTSAARGEAELPVSIEGFGEVPNSFEAVVEVEARGGRGGAGSEEKNPLFKAGDEPTERRRRVNVEAVDSVAAGAAGLGDLRFEGKRKKLFAPVASGSAERPRPNKPVAAPESCAGTSALPRRDCEGRPGSCSPVECCLDMRRDAEFRESRRRSVSSRNSECAEARDRLLWAILSSVASSSCDASCCDCVSSRESVSLDPARDVAGLNAPCLRRR